MKTNKRYLLLLGTLVLLVSSSYAQFTQTVKLYYVDAIRVQNGLKKVIAKSQQVYGTGGGGGGIGDYVEGTITTGAGNGLNFLDCTVELTSITGDTANGSAQLYIFTSQRDREVTLTKGNSDLIDNYRVRVDKVDPKRQEADITIRVAGNTGQSIGNGQHPPGKVSISADTKTNSVTISTGYQVDLNNLLLWVKLWDQPQNQSLTAYNYNPPAYLLQPKESVSTTAQKKE